MNANLADHSSLTQNSPGAPRRQRHSRNDARPNPAGHHLPAIRPASVPRRGRAIIVLLYTLRGSPSWGPLIARGARRSGRMAAQRVAAPGVRLRPAPSCAPPREATVVASPSGAAGT